MTTAGEAVHGQPGPPPAPGTTGDGGTTGDDGSAGGIFGGGRASLTFGIVAVVFLVAFEAMAVNTALPVAVKALDGLPLYALAFSGFLTASLFSMVLAGEHTDARGPVLPLLGGIGLFGSGLVLAGAASGMAVFVLGRAVQGFGAGLVIVALYVVVARKYPERLRPRVFSAMAAGWVIPSIVGPLVAGFVTERLSWRWVFLAIPVLVLPAALMMLPHLRHLPPAATSDTPPVRRTGRKRLALVAALGVALLQYSGQHVTAAGLALAAGALALVVPASSRLLPNGTLRAGRGLPTVILMRGILAGAFFGAEAFVPLMLVNERGLSPTQAGMTLTAAALAWTLGSWYQGRPDLRVPRHRLVRFGTALVGVGTAGAALALWEVLPPAAAAAGWAFGGLGMGLAMTSVNVLMLELSPPAEQGANAAALQFCDVLFSVLTVALAGSIFAGLHTAAGADTAVFALIFLLMSGLALVGAVVAPRVRPAG